MGVYTQCSMHGQGCLYTVLYTLYMGSGSTTVGAMGVCLYMGSGSGTVGAMGVYTQCSIHGQWVRNSRSNGCLYTVPIQWYWVCNIRYNGCLYTVLCGTLVPYAVVLGLEQYEQWVSLYSALYRGIGSATVGTTGVYTQSFVVLLCPTQWYQVWNSRSNGCLYTVLYTGVLGLQQQGQWVSIHSALWYS